METEKSNRRLFNIGLIILLIIFLFLFLDRSVKNATGPEFEDVSNNLEETTWYWVGFSDPKQKFTIDNPERYSITITKDGQLNIKADCNVANTTVVIDGQSVSVQEPMAMTMAMCPPGSKSDEFVNNLTNAATYFIKDGVLYVDLIYDSGTMVFISGDELPPSTSSAAKNATYEIEGQSVTLIDGRNEEPVPNSSTVVTTEVWGEPTTTTIEGDSADFAAVVLLQQPGGSGSFYYIAACVDNADGTCTGTNAILIGDRVAIQNVLIQDDETIIVNYATQAPGDPLSAPSSVGQTGTYILTGTTLTEAN